MSSFLSLIVCSVVAFISFAQPAAALTPLQRAKQVIPNFRQVDAGIFSGGNPADSPYGLNGVRALKDLNIGTVVDLQGGDIQDPIGGWLAWQLEPGEHEAMIRLEENEVRRLQIKFIRMPLSSISPVSKSENLKILTLMDFITKPENLPIFIHCEHGVDRSGLVVALHRVLHESWKPARAMTEWEASGHSEVNKLFTGALDVYFYKVVRAGKFF